MLEIMFINIHLNHNVHSYSKICTQNCLYILGVTEATEKLARCEITEPTFTSPPPPTAPTQSDPVKRLKNLRKKLREIEALQEKISSGALKNPDSEQKEKISRKNEIMKEIDILEKSSN